MSDVFETEKKHPDLELDSLDNLWFQVSGTLCNIECDHCFISCSPTNHNYEFMSYEQCEKYLKESVKVGVKEYYFTGGEPFMNKEIYTILEKTLEYGPASVLTNGMLINPEKANRLKEISDNSIYTLEMRLSLDGYNEEMNDDIRGKGVFKKAMEGMKNLIDNGFLPIITMTQTWDENENEKVLEEFNKTLKEHGYDRPRLKILPALKIGKEAVRSKGYDKYEYVYEDMLEGYEVEQLVCSNSRVATNRGVAVCPILLDYEDAILGDTLEEASKPYKLKHQACYTCYLYGAICSNFSSGAVDA